ncbi:MAG: Hpt domain-containing protein, partial [Betaproteobacteria bacterium]
MTNESTNDFDLGPLTWVRDEIDQALAKGLAALAGFAGQPDDRMLLKHAQTHIHQAAGAVQIVGLDGAITLVEEVERHLVLLESLEPEAIAPHIDAIGAACRRLTRYLNDLTEGEPPVTLKLYPEYEALTRLRGAESASPTDLFYPDLTRRPPQPAAADGAPSNRSPAYLRSQRRNYQQGLLAWLRGDAQGLARMRESVQAIEQAFAGTVVGAFWWTVGGFLASAAARGILPSYTVKQLCARIDLQIRRFVEGSTKVADRLRREVLYHVAISEPVDQRIKDVQTLYGLPAMIPQKNETRQVDLDRIQPLLKRAQEVVVGIKDNWLKFTGGRREALTPIAHGLGELRTLASGLHEPAFSELVIALESVVTAANRTGSVPDVLAMEFATGMLLTEDAIGHFARLSDKFPRQVEAMRRRLDFANSGVLSLPGAEEDLLDDMARRAQERMLLSQVAREIQGNLRHIEKVLDAFFRDADERSELAGLGAYTRQIQGALSMLGLPEANELLQMCQAQIDTYSAGAPVNGEELELLAESLSGLGFYIDAVEQQRPDAARLLEPFLRRRLGLDVESLSAVPEHSVETAFEARREDLPVILDKFRAAPQDPALRAELGLHLQGLRQDADLVADDTFSARAADALAALEDSQVPAVDLLARLDELAPESASVAPAPSEETIRLLAAGEEKLDAELGEIFLIEAKEVLSAVVGHLAECEANPEDYEALGSIRRGFHTLKGSGRMVGLLELGETAYTVERVLNRWLDEERPVVPELLEVLREAERGFSHWVSELQSHGTVHVDDGTVSAAIARLESAHPPVLAALAPPFAEEIAESLPAPAGVETIEITALAEPFPDESREPSAMEPEVLVADAPTPDEITVGDVHISPSLYRILLEETANHLDSLRHGQAALQFDPQARPTDAMVRAAHTLTGIYRTAGFAPVADTAHALENALLSLQNNGLRPESTLPVLA